MSGAAADTGALEADSFRPIFLSYARRTSAASANELARALRGALSENSVFLDTSDIETAAEFPETLARAVLGAQIVVVFADQTYFERWYCLRELRLALLAPDQIVVALGADPDLTLLPSGSTKNWPQASDTTALLELIRRRLAADSLSVGQRDPAKARALLQITIEEARLPPAMPIPPDVPHAGNIAPSIGERFVGRSDDLERLHFALSTVRAQGAALSATISAAGGFGKTRLAIEYLHRYGARHYQGGLFWITADPVSDFPGSLQRASSGLEEQFYSTLVALRSDGSVPSLFQMRQEGISVRSELAKALTAATRPILYVIDNVPETPAGQSPRPIDEFCPSPGGMVTVLVTSRQRSFEQNMKSIFVDILPRASSVALLTYDIADRAALSESEWEEISCWAGDLPLALDLLNRSLFLDLPATKLLERARSRATTAELDGRAALLKRQVADKALRGVTETFSISFDLLDEAGKRCALALAFLADTPIPNEIVDALLDESERDRVRGDLRARNFAIGGVDLVFGSMHRLLADFLCGMAAGFLPFREAVHGVLLAMQPDYCCDPKYWPMMSLCEPHAVALLVRLLTLWEKARQAKADVDAEQMTVEICALIRRLALLSMSKGDYTKARGLTEIDLLMSRRTFGNAHQSTLTAMNNLAEVARRQGLHQEACELLEQVLSAGQQVLDKAELLKSYGNLALSYQALGLQEKARDIQEWVLKSTMADRGPEAEDTLRAMANLGYSLQRSGDFPRALQLQEQVFSVRNRVLGSDHPETMLAAENFAPTLAASGYPNEAKKLMVRLHERSRVVLGDRHPDTLRRGRKLADLRSRGNSP